MNEDIGLMENGKLSAAYKDYVEKATLTMKQLNSRNTKAIIQLVSLPFDIWALIEFWIFKTGGLHFLFNFLLGIVVGTVLRYAFLIFMYIRSGKLMEIERTEGYSPRYYEELKKDKSVSTVVAECYNVNGYADKALEQLDKTDPNTFAKTPSNAHFYYSALITALSLKGEREKAEKAYNSGLYYLKTYMNSPAFGDRVSLSLAIYEYCGGNYDAAVWLTDNAVRIITASHKKKNRIPDECVISAALYWKAMCFASMGKKATARDIIYSCRELYASDYYKKCFAKLFEDMANDDNRKNEVKNETIS